MGIFVRDGDELLPMREQPYEAEAVLQKLLASYPGLLAGDEGGQRRWVIIQRELRIADAEGAGGRWSLDHLFLDDQGVPTLVEVKRSSDTRIRREVVGQLLDYAANAVVYWDAESIRSRFEARCLAANQDPEEELAEFLGDDQDAEAFWQLVKTNIAAGNLRLVFVADRIPRELQRVIEYLNEQMRSTEVIGLEVKQYTDATGERQTLVSRVIGQTEAARSLKPSRSAAAVSNWPAYAERLSETEFAIVRALYDATAGAIADRGLNWDLVLRRASIRIRPADGPSVGSILFRHGGRMYLQIVLPQAPGELSLENPYPALVSKWKAAYNEWAWEIPSADLVPDVGAAIDIAKRFV